RQSPDPPRGMRGASARTLPAPRENLTGPRWQPHRVDLRDNRGRVEQPDFLRIDPDVRAGPVGDEAAPFHADLAGQRRLPRPVTPEVHGAEARHRRLPPFRAVFRGPPRADLAVDDPDLGDVCDLWQVEVARDPRSDMARRG